MLTTDRTNTAQSASATTRNEQAESTKMECPSHTAYLRCTHGCLIQDEIKQGVKS